jgi:DNA invertase Pin-like site-specific DNA recombinase
MNKTDDNPIYDILVRISRVGERQLGSEKMHSDVEQIESGRHAIAALGGTVGKVFEAYDESGSTVFSSDEWTEALNRVKSGASNGAVVSYVDRFGRNTPEGLAYAAALTVAGGALIVNGRPVDFTDPYEKAMFAQAMVQAELTVDIAKKRARTTMDNVHKRGITNKAPYGYARNEGLGGKQFPDSDAKMLVIVEEQAEVVRLVFAMRADGEKWPAIIKALHAQDVCAPRGAAYWTASTLADMVKSRTYVGETLVGGHVTRKAHAPIVTEAEWKAAQSKAVKVRNGKHRPGIAGGLLVCSGCGNPLQVQSSGNGHTFYGCARMSSAGPCPAPVTGKQSVLDDYVDGLVAAALDGGMGLTVVRAHHDLTAAKEAMQAAIDDEEQFVLGTVGMKSAAIAKGVTMHEVRVKAATDAYQAQLAAVSAVEDALESLPLDGDAYRALPVAGRKKVAADLVERIELGPFPRGASRSASVASDRLAAPVWKLS